MSTVQLSPRERVEGMVVRGLGALPERAQLLLGGPRPLRIDGQEIEPEVQLLLRLRALGRRPPVESLSVPQAREEVSRDAASFAGAPLPVARVDEIAVPGAAGMLGARLYVPAGLPSPPGEAADLVYLHGGGWVVGDLDTHDQPCRFLAREAGILVLSIDYRRAPEHKFPAPVDDCLAALRSRSTTPGAWEPTRRAWPSGATAPEETSPRPSPAFARSRAAPPPRCSF